MVQRFSIFDIQLSKTNLKETFVFLSAKNLEKSEYILFPDLSVISEATHNEKLKKIINEAYLALPDGKPSEFIAKIKGFDDVGTVSGYKLILKLLQESSCTHFFYGSTNDKLLNIQSFLSKYDQEEEKILGYKSPPFLALNEIPGSSKIREDLEEINKLNPDFIWIGLSSPKQDYLVYHHHHLLDSSYLMGVGGVFDYLSGEVTISPEWMKKMGIRWLYRLWKEPKRLFPKYRKIFTNLARYILS